MRINYEIIFNLRTVSLEKAFFEKKIKFFYRR